MLSPSVVDNFHKTKGTRCIMHCNITSVAKNNGGLCTLLNQHLSMYAIIAVTEICLTPRESYTIPSNLYKTDTKESKDRGAGVLLYIRKPLAYRKCSFFTAAISRKCLYVEIDDVIYGASYIPP